MRQRIAAPLLVGLVTGGCGAAVWLTSSGSPGRVLASLLLLLVLPGAALSHLLRWREHRRPGGGLLLVAALSLAVVVVDSVVLYAVGVRLDVHVWTISVGAITEAASVAGFFRPSPLLGLLAFHRLRRLGPVCLATIAAAVLVSAAVLVTIGGVRAQARADHFTQLWILPDAGNPGAATVGVFNHEGKRENYQLNVSVDGRVQSTLAVQLRADRGWSTTVFFAGQATRVRATLALASAPGLVYREVQLRLPATPSSSNSSP
jgi:uncharacterized membrane protein YbhN (UPF0104 family)